MKYIPDDFKKVSLQIIVSDDTEKMSLTQEQKFVAPHRKSTAIEGCYHMYYTNYEEK